ncbi:restriction endonuclease subunit S [Acinetobacter bereziniae]|uniref:restriction endonuclease subunit S n=1 Tax=Acinetobacter bereziniae TaxID=106648 RepID=UPI003AF7F438
MSEHWISTTLGEYILFKNGKSSPSRDIVEDIPVYGSNGIIGFSSESNAEEDSLIIGRVGSYCGSVYHSKKKCWVTDNAIIGLPKAKGESEFWYFLLTKLQLNSYRSGSGQPLVNQSTLNSIPIEIPKSPSVRQAIGKQLFSFENKIHLNNQINQTLESIAQAIFKSWFIDFDPVRAKIAAKQEGKDAELAAMCMISGKSEEELKQMSKDDFAELQATAALFPDELVESELGEVPKGWEVSTVGEQVQAVGGGTPSTKNADFWDNGIHYWTTPKDLSNLTDKILLNTERKITDAGLKKISSGLLPKNTVLMSSRAPVGYLALAKIEVAINQGYIAILPNTKYSAEYLIQWCEANMAEIKGRASGTTFLEISKKNFREINFICSDEKVVTVYTKTVKTLYDEISLKAEENQSLINLRDTLLPKLLSGELDVSSLEEIIHV